MSKRIDIINNLDTAKSILAMIDATIEQLADDKRKQRVSYALGLSIDTVETYIDQCIEYLDGLK